MHEVHCSWHLIGPDICLLHMWRCDTSIIGIKRAAEANTIMRSNRKGGLYFVIVLGAGAEPDVFKTLLE
jgi:hypothetical protein